MGDQVAKSVQRLLRWDLGQAAEERTRLVGTTAYLVARFVHRRVGPQWDSASACSASSVIGPSSNDESRGSEPPDRRASRVGSVGTPSRRSVPGVLPDSSVSLAMSMTSSESWKAVPICSPNSVRTASASADTPAIFAPNRADVAISEPVLSATTEVVHEVVVPVAGPDGLANLPLHQAGEGLRLDPHGLGSEIGHDVRRPREEEVSRSRSRPSCPIERWRSEAPAAGLPRP